MFFLNAHAYCETFPFFNVFDTINAPNGVCKGKKVKQNKSPILFGQKDKSSFILEVSYVKNVHTLWPLLWQLLLPLFYKMRQPTTN